MRRTTIACSSRVLVGVQQLLAEVGVDGGIGGAVGGAGQGDGLGAVAFAADQELRRGRRRKALSPRPAQNT